MEHRLSEGEAWMLRYIGLHHHAYKTCEVHSDNWPPHREIGLSDKGMPRELQEVRVCVEGLEKRKLVEACWTADGVSANITGHGLDCLWELDHPNIVEKLQDWAWRSPYVAYAILAILAIGASSSFFKLVWTIAVATWTWLFGA